MSEQRMIEAVNAAVSHHGFDDTVVVAGQFNPRGATGAMFTGGLVGDQVGALAGPAGDAIGTVGGALAARRCVAGAQGLPVDMIVGASADWVYGFAGRSRSREPQRLVFRLPRAGLTATARGRMNVRTLFLSAADGARVELEGNRLPITHSKDVVDALTR
jgi:hypothetical protein